ALADARTAGCGPSVVLSPSRSIGGYPVYVGSHVFFYTFRRPQRYTLFPYTTLFRSTGSEPGDVVIGDFNADGYLDVSTANHRNRSEEHTSELQSRGHLVCRLLLEKKKDRTGRPYNAHIGSRPAR